VGNLLQICKCGHDKSSHYREMSQSTKDVSAETERRYVYCNCLATWCTCKKYEEKSWDDD